MIGKRIKKLRLDRGYSLTELAEQAGVSKSYLSYIERDLKNNPSVQFLSKIADTLDSSLEYLLGMDKTSNGNKNKEELDDEWINVLKSAISNGMSNEDLKEFREFIRYKNWKTSNKR